MNKTKYEELMEQADGCIIKAINTKDINLQIFYVNAAEGFRRKASKLTLEGAAYDN